MSETYLIAVVLVAAAVTFVLRAAPFALVSRLKKSQLLPWLGARMPVGIMVILVVYTVHDIDLGDATQLLPLLIGLAVTVGLHLWRRNPVLSIVAGTLACIGVSALVG
jgi:Predicted branched-chain amino acid permeases (azaleucine resistance)